MNTINFCNSDNKKELERLKTEMRISLNPRDVEDKKIIKCMAKIIKCNGNNKKNEYTDKLEELVSQLLKHDWERSKKEAGIGKKSKKHDVQRAYVHCEFLKDDK